MQVKSSGILSLEKDKPNGKCRKWRLWANTAEEGRKFRRFTGTYSMARRALDDFVRELGAVIPNGDTLAAYAEARVEARAASGDISPNTIDKERRNVRAIARAPFAGMRMDEIGPADCRKSLAWIKANPQRPNLVREEGLSNTTMRGIYRFVRQTFGQAVDDELLARNPMAKVKDPRDDSPEVEALPWRELERILDLLDKEPMSGYVMALYLIVCDALRRAESVAVLDAEVQTSMFHVSQAVKEADGTVDDPKSEAGKRDMPVLPRLWEKVGEMRAWKKARGLADALPLACNHKGGVIRPQNLYRWWKRITEGTDFEDVGLHQIRHSNLSHVARRMSAYDLMRYAGWSSLEPTRTYIHDDYATLSRCYYEAFGMEGSDAIRLAA